MAYGIRITGLQEARRRFGRPVDVAINAGVKMVALEVQGVIAPYPPATLANSPENPTGRWYERGYGPRWWVRGASPSLPMRSRPADPTQQRRAILRAARRGMIAGRKTSQMMNRGWSLKQRGRIGWVLGNRATYSGYLHSEDKQARWAGARGWITDRTAVQRVVDSNVATRIFAQALRNLYGGR